MDRPVARHRPLSSDFHLPVLRGRRWPEKEPEQQQYQRTGATAGHYQKWDADVVEGERQGRALWCSAGQGIGVHRDLRCYQWHDAQDSVVLGP